VEKVGKYVEVVAPTELETQGFKTTVVVVFIGMARNKRWGGEFAQLLVVVSKKQHC